jgi:(p)ppGpp synthase/HD superfamily hydrolase
MSTLKRAIEIAEAAHAGQKDKGGNPYIGHPMRVMHAVDLEEEKIVAILHDVVEDTHWTLEKLRKEGFSETVLAAIDSVTKRKEQCETYDEFVKRAASNPIGRKVKLADLRDNSDISRIPNPTPEDYKRIEKYRNAIRTINDMD